MIRHPEKEPGWPHLRVDRPQRSKNQDSVTWAASLKDNITYHADTDMDKDVPVP